MTVAPPNPPIVCLVCGMRATRGDQFCAQCGALLPDQAPIPVPTDRGPEQLFRYEGRIGRIEYLVSAAVLSLFLMIALGLLGAMWGHGLGMPLGATLVVAAAFSLTCANIKRLHDGNSAGWIAVVGVIPVINWLLILALALMSPTDGANRYGLPDSGSIRLDRD